ncbi:winged helix-turn-helix transcriptional regulator [Clostridium sp. YIM B02515]|uniref:Winged helix-turn-helix transcriptional regulator n=1 Tax=Clostridium rhizosphaerae TaxID=2803861 RepID=A0ABS1TBK9_9CLOT|nr:metalloregulator ArsR/SmtB family transcription factor [Clostridium rhizosphaerae]MBL4936021.1 winged helix-turn-helix transcriptional regulator [Clostridium rhizosphaerae]
MENNIEVCKCEEIHNDCVNCVKESMLKDEVFTDVSELFKVFGDYTRIKIIYALLKKELCVCDIAEVLNMSQSSISHQLRVLKAARLVKFRKEGKVVYYSLDDEHVGSIFNAGLSHVEHK